MFFFLLVNIGILCYNWFPPQLNRLFFFYKAKAYWNMIILKSKKYTFCLRLINSISESSIECFCFLTNRTWWDVGCCFKTWLLGSLVFKVRNSDMNTWWPQQIQTENLRYHHKTTLRKLHKNTTNKGFILLSSFFSKNGQHGIAVWTCAMFFLFVCIYLFWHTWYR